MVSLLDSEQGFAVAGQAKAPDDALGGLPDAEVMLWDVGPRSAPTPSSAVLERIPTLALVRDEETALELLRAGALGVLLRGAEGERVLAALRGLAIGLGAFEPSLLRTLLAVRAADRKSVV